MKNYEVFNNIFGEYKKPIDHAIEMLMGEIEFEFDIIIKDKDSYIETFKANLEWLEKEKE